MDRGGMEGEREREGESQKRLRCNNQTHMMLASAQKAASNTHTHSSSTTPVHFSPNQTIIMCHKIFRIAKLLWLSPLRPSALTAS